MQRQASSLVAEKTHAIKCFPPHRCWAEWDWTARSFAAVFIARKTRRRRRRYTCTEIASGTRAKQHLKTMSGRLLHGERFCSWKRFVLRSRDISCVVHARVGTVVGLVPTVLSLARSLARSSGRPACRHPRVKSARRLRRGPSRVSASPRVVTSSSAASVIRSRAVDSRQSLKMWLIGRRCRPSFITFFSTSSSVASQCALNNADENDDDDDAAAGAPLFHFKYNSV